MHTLYFMQYTVPIVKLQVFSTGNTTNTTSGRNREIDQQFPTTPTLLETANVLHIYPLTYYPSSPSVN